MAAVGKFKSPTRGQFIPDQLATAERGTTFKVPRKKVPKYVPSISQQLSTLNKNGPRMSWYGEMDYWEVPDDVYFNEGPWIFTVKGIPYQLDLNKSLWYYDNIVTPLPFWEI